MGGIFSSPDVPEPVDTAAIAEEAAAEERASIIESQRRGMASTVNTSYQGILTEKTNDTSDGLTRKSLLGE
ncbi:MAG: hypothetical protein R3Y43_02930 [Alphaproteobacteria bacterium]